MIMEILEDAFVPLDHPCLEGHFPKNPVVPGTLILEKILTALSGHWPDARVSEVVNAKFLSPLKPGERFSMRISRQSGSVNFECNRNGELLATGRLAVSISG